MVLLIYNFASDKFTVTEIIQSSYRNSLNPLDYPIFFKVIDTYTKEIIDPDDYDFSISFQNPEDRQTYPGTLEKCKINKYKYYKRFGDKLKPFLNSELWETSYCCADMNANLTSSKNVAANPYGIEIRVMLNGKGTVHNYTFEITTLYDELDTSKNENNIFLSPKTYIINVEDGSEYFLYAYFTKNIFKVTDEFINYLNDFHNMLFFL